MCSGVIAITDDPKIFFKNFLKMLTKKGSIYLFHHFNKFNFNVFIKYQDLKKPNYLQSGWNIFSLNYIKEFFHNKKIKT